jgi:inositol-pentakisphosphate 2-kinase
VARLANNSMANDTTARLDIQELFSLARNQLADPESQAWFEHFAEGRANAVFRIRIPHLRETQSGSIDGVLLRAPKSTPGVTPYDYPRLQQYREQVIEPAVGLEHLVPQLLVELSQEHALDLNKARDPEGTNPSRINAGYAMLIQDMSPRQGQLGLEFKPKWLAQSPIAPPKALRCRTCAREAYRNSQKARQGEDIPPPVCPLGLVDPDARTRQVTICQLTPRWPWAAQSALLDALKTDGILEKLRGLQEQLDPGNAMFESPGDKDFGLAMTLRDCTCFVRMTPDRNGAVWRVEIALADLDEKNWEAKQEYWQESHTTLVENKFYFAGERPPVNTACLIVLNH